MWEGLPEWLKILFTGIGGLGAGGYAVHRTLKRDQTSDKLDERAQAIITRLESQLEAERRNNQILGQNIDRIAAERNSAVQQVGRLEGTVHALEGEVGRLRTEIQSLETKNSELTKQIAGLHGEVRSLVETMRQLMAQNGTTA
ncbi:chemotaxis protein [Pseudomonas phage Dolphis]|nr:chemotaxis protein [Pseudomonas phage Dolphis]